MRVLAVCTKFVACRTSEVGCRYLSPSRRAQAQHAQSPLGTSPRLAGGGGLHGWLEMHTRTVTRAIWVKRSRAVLAADEGRVCI